MSLLEIEALGGPLIANVRSSPQTQAYDHWVCVEATEEGLVVYDGSAPGRLVSPASFMAEFSGIGIAVSRDAFPWTMITIARLGGFLALLASAYAGLFFWQVRPNASVLKNSTTILFSTLLVCGVLTTLFDAANGYSKGMELALAPHKNSDFREGDLDDLRLATTDPGIILVDARTADSFSHGSLDRAVNIPVSATFHEIDLFTTKLPRNTNIVVFCQSERCGYDDVIGKKLAKIGFKNVVVSRQGVAEFRKTQKKRG